MKTSVIIVAAGMGSRMDRGINKQFIQLGAYPILYHTIKVFQDTKEIDSVVLVLKADEIEFVKMHILSKYNFSKLQCIVEGGKERSDSVFNGIQECQKADIILIHDGARPFIISSDVVKVIKGAETYGAAILGVKLKDTIKELDEDNCVVKTYNRNKIWSVQTPQGFKASYITEAYRQKKRIKGIIWDDAMLVERTLGHKVKMVEGSYENIKITTPIDLIVGEAILKARLT